MKWNPFAKSSPEPEPEPAQVRSQGQPVHLNLAPASKLGVLRILGRMERLIEYQKKTHLEQAQLDGALQEYAQKKAILVANGFIVPSDIDGLRKLAKEVEQGDRS